MLRHLRRTKPVHRDSVALPSICPTSQHARDVAEVRPLRVLLFQRLPSVFRRVFEREKVSGIVARQRWMCFRDRGNCVVPLATVANAEPRNAQQREHKHGYEEDHHRDQDRHRPRQERFGKETGHQEAARDQDRQGDHGEETGRHQNDRQKDVADRRGLGGFEEGPQTHVLQRDGRSDGETRALDFPGRQDARRNTLRRDPPRPAKGHRRPIQEGSAQ